MCRFFSCVITRDGRILFTSTSSHEDIILSAQLRDSEDAARSFQRIEIIEALRWVAPTTQELVPYVSVDEAERADWLTDEMLDRAKQLFERINPINKGYAKRAAEAQRHYEIVRNKALARADKKVSALYDQRAAGSTELIQQIDEQVKGLSGVEKGKRIQVLNEELGLNALWDKYYEAKNKVETNCHRSTSRAYKILQEKQKAIKAEYAAAISGIDGYVISQE